MNQLFTTLLALTIFLSACTSTQEASNEPKAKPKKQKPAKKKAAIKEENIVLTKKNAVEILSAYGKKHPENEVIMHTSLGDMTIKLYDDTPLHRANFIRLAKQDYFDSTLFFRVVKDFMIQGGDSDKRVHRKKKKAAGNYFVPAEMHAHYVHKRGALAAARFYEKNPTKESAAFEFYIIQGVKYNQPMLDQFGQENNLTFTPFQAKTYKSVGGAPHLDGEHTVYGELTSGFDILDKIANVQVGEKHWPIDDVWVLDVEIVKK